MEKSAKDKPTAPTITSQINSFLASNNSLKLNNIKFGKIEILVRNGVIYNILISDSILVKTEESELGK